MRLASANYIIKRYTTANHIHKYVDNLRGMYTTAYQPIICMDKTPKLLERQPAIAPEVAPTSFARLDHSYSVQQFQLCDGVPVLI